MIHSESIVKLAVALSKAQGTMKHAVKDADNPFFRSKYADLQSVVEASRPSLVENGLSIVQCTEGNVLWTMLLHESGEWVKGSIELKPMRQVKDTGWVDSHDRQSYGSCITYARRYAMAAITGVATEDDDGNAASGNKVATKSGAVNPAVPPPAVEKPPPITTPAEGEKSIQDLRHDLAELGQIAFEAGIYPSLGDAIQSFTSTEKFQSKCRDVAGLQKDWAIKKAITKANAVLNSIPARVDSGDDQDIPL
jgi:hypothetical protein